MKEIFKDFTRSVSNFLCFLSLLSLCLFCITAYSVPIDRMCRVYVFQLRWVVILFSMMLTLIFAIDDALWERIWTGSEEVTLKNSTQMESTGNKLICDFKKYITFTADDEEPALTELESYKKAKLKAALRLLPASIVITEATLYAISELGRLSISLEFYLLFSSAITLMLFFGMMFRRDILCGEVYQSLTIHQKSRIRSIVTVACVVLALMFIPRASDRIGTYNMYWEGSPQTPFSFEYRVDENCVLSVENVDGYDEGDYIQYFDLMPKKVLSKFVKDGWTIRIDSNYLAEFSWQNNGKRYGPLFYAITDYPSKTIITHSCYPAIREIGRYCYNEISDKETVNQLFSSEGKRLLDEGARKDALRRLDFENPEVFFATCFAEYVLTRNDATAAEQLAHTIPLTYNYLSTSLFDYLVE